MDFTLPYGHFFLDAYRTNVLTVLWTVVLSVPNSTDSTSGHFFMTCTVRALHCYVCSHVCTFICVCGHAGVVALLPG